MSAKKKAANVVDSKGQRRHSRNCTVKKGPGQYEEPDVVSSSDEEPQQQYQAQATTDEIEDDTILLINAVHKRQPLWDNRLTKVERPQTLLETLWAEVDEELGWEPGKAKITWGAKRHKFSAEVRKTEAGGQTCWPYYNSLLFLLVTRQGNQSLTAASPQTSTTNNVKQQQQQVPQVKKKKGSKNHQVIQESTQLIPLPVQRETYRAREPLFMPSTNSQNNRMKREVSMASSDSEVDVVEEINLTNGSMLQRHMDNPISYKRVCIRRMQETQVENIEDDGEDDEIKRFCSYLEVMLRKIPKMHQEMFCEETLDHLASVNRKLRRSNY